jgi:endonuclease/exonuclease/phosphatase family metal-dependent hydrolase
MVCICFDGQQGKGSFAMDIIPTGRVKVMTWNIWWRFGPNWQDRQPALLQTMRAIDADVIALQEAWGSTETTQADEFADQLGMYAGFAAPSYPPTSDVPRPEDDDLTLGLGLLSRWPIDTLRQVEIPNGSRWNPPRLPVHPSAAFTPPIIERLYVNSAGGREAEGQVRFSKPSCE